MSDITITHYVNNEHFKTNWSLCSGYKDEELYVTPITARVTCEDCKAKMPKVFSVLHINRSTDQLSILCQIKAHDRKEAIEVVMFFVDRHIIQTLDGKGVNFNDLQLLDTHTAVYSK